MIRTFIPLAHGLVQRMCVLWKEELSRDRQRNVCLLQLRPEPCIKIGIRTLTFSLQVTSLTSLDYKDQGSLPASGTFPDKSPAAETARASRPKLPQPNPPKSPSLIWCEG